MRGIYVWAAGAAILLAVAALVLWLFLSPGWAIQAAQDALRQQLGRELAVRDGARLSLIPFSIALEHASVPASGSGEDAFLSAETVRIPVSAGQFLTRNPDFSSVALEKADIAFLIDERGQPNWAFGAPAASAPFTLDLVDSALRYYDARNQQALSASGVNARVRISAEGEIAFNGTAIIHGRLARFELTLKSLARVHDGGSPLALSVETPELGAAFDGRIATGNVLSLTGPVNISMPDLVETMRWAGIDIGAGPAEKNVTVSGGLDSVGRALAVRSATVAVGGAAFTGDIAIDTRNTVPKLQAALSASSFSLDSILPSPGAKSGDWGTAPLGLGLLRAIDAEMTLETPAFSFGTITDEPARLAVTLTGGSLKSSLEALPADGSRLKIEANIDAKASPPAFEIDLASEGLAAERVLPAFTGIDWLTGTGIVLAKLAGSGETQQQIVGTLRGTGSFALSNGSIAGLDIAKSLASVSQAITEGWSSATDSATPFQSMSGEFSVADGIAALSQFKFASPGLDVSAEGDVDLLRRAIDLRADPKLVTADAGAKAGLPVKTAIKGPWGAPRLYPDIEGILKNPAEGYQKLRALGAASGD